LGIGLDNVEGLKAALQGVIRMCDTIPGKFNQYGQCYTHLHIPRCDRIQKSAILIMEILLGSGSGY
jgi:hypothetical protein